VGVLAGLLWGGVYGVESIIANHDAKTEAKYSQILATQTTLTQAIEAKLAADEVGWAQQNAALKDANDNLASSMAARDQQINSLIAKIGQMNPPQLQADIQPKLRKGQATALPDGVKLDTPAAQDVDAQITEGANAKADLAATQSQLANQTAIAANATQDAKETHTALTAEQDKNAAQVKSCDATIASVKADARKSKAKWFLIGYVSGFLTRVLTVK
jgi:chromosome segregation ATPase